MLMRPEDYVAAAIRTAPTLKADEHSFVLGGLGIAGEAIEAYETIQETVVDQLKVVKELGDVTWYIALICHVHNLKFEGLFVSNQFAQRNVSFVVFPGNKWKQLDKRGKSLLSSAKDVSEYVKKAVFHKHPVDIRVLRELLERLAVRVQYVAAVIDVDIEEVLDKNIDKLKVRYPERFTTEGSMNKDENQE